jgi:hypothetical protein
VICGPCAAGADNATDYRTADRVWRSQHTADHPAAGGGWLLTRLRWCMSLHRACKGCTCQHVIPELKSRP